MARTRWPASGSRPGQHPLADQQRPRRRTRRAPARSASAGTVNGTSGRCSARRAPVNSALVTGSGAVRLTGPARSSCRAGSGARRPSRRSDDPDHHCRPLPSRAAEPEPEERQHPAEHAALARLSTSTGAQMARPGRRRPRRARWRPPSRRTARRRKPVPAGAGLVDHPVAGVAVEADRRSRTASTRGRPSSAGQRARPACAVPSTRLSTSSRLYASVQRRSPMPAPGQVDDGVDALQRRRVEPPPHGSQRTSSVRRGRRGGPAGRRSCPSARSARTSAVPMQPRRAGTMAIFHARPPTACRRRAGRTGPRVAVRPGSAATRDRARPRSCPPRAAP